MTLVRTIGVVDMKSVAFDVVRQQDGSTEHVPSDMYGSGSFTPRRVGTYLISASFWSWDCSGGPGTESQYRGPYTTPQIARSVVEGDPPATRYFWYRFPKNGLPLWPGIGFGSAIVGTGAACPTDSGSVKPITTTMRYTTDGRPPTLQSPSVRVTAQHGCRTQGGRERSRHSAWGRLTVNTSGGSKASAIVTPGHVLRVWLEMRLNGRVVSAIRVGSRERNGLQSWVRDSGSCPRAPGGCARLEHNRRAERSTATALRLVRRR
jgi:hypothetical protein